MIREAIGVADTIEKAKEEACKALGVDASEAEFEVLQLPEKKVLGLFGGKEAKVRAFVNPSPLDLAKGYLEKMISAMGIEGTSIEMSCEDNNVDFVISGDNASMLIGRRGETLDALQYLTSLVANHVDDNYYRISINVGDYREKRKETLSALGRKHALLAARKGFKHSFEPMNPYERRIIHTAVQEIEGATSWSEGENARRHVVIGPDQNARQNYRRRSGYSKGGYNKNKSYSSSESFEKREPKVVDDLSDKGVSLYGKVEY